MNDKHMVEQSIQASGLPAQYYRDPAYLKRELEIHFVNGWASIGVAQSVPNAGDANPLSLAGHPLLVTRARDEQVRVFHNVCRHRGTQLITEACNRGNGLITCPYHAWSYKLDGKLAAAPKCGVDNASKEQLGLVPVRTAIWMDIIFVNLSGTAQPFDEFIRPLAERWARFDFSPLRLAMRETFPAECNWKVIAENYIDVLHLPPVHPQLGVQDITGYEHEFSFLSRDISGYLANMGDTVGGFSPGQIFPDGPPGYETSTDLIFVFPNTSIVIAPSWVQISILQPDGPTAATGEIIGYLLGDEAVANAGQDLTATLRELAIQDLDIMNRQQAGRGGDVSDQGYMVSHWDELQATLFRRISECYSD